MMDDEGRAQDSGALAVASMALAVQELVLELKAMRLENDKMRALLSSVINPPPGGIAALMGRITAYLNATDTKKNGS